MLNPKAFLFPRKNFVMSISEKNFFPVLDFINNFYSGKGKLIIHNTSPFNHCRNYSLFVFGEEVEDVISSLQSYEIINNIHIIS